MTHSHAAGARPGQRADFNRFLLWVGACRFFTLSLAFHLIVVLVFGGAVLFHVVQEPPDFVGGSGTFVMSAPDPQPPAAAPDLSQSLTQEFTPSMPTIAPPPLSAISTTSIQTTFNVANVPKSSALGVADSVKDAMASLKGIEEAVGRTAAGMGRAGGMANVSFFGVKTRARRLAFLVDYSGSMSGPFRKTMEAELERSLIGLPAGTEVLIIPWAGGAWLYNQLATEIADKWRKLDNYDNFAIRPGEKLTRPEWVNVTPENVRKLMDGIRAQKAWPGGTDWRSPFNYVMESNPHPDTIFFMTDGQISDVTRAMEGIDKAMKKSMRPPTVFALWITNKAQKPEPLKALAEKYKGEFREVGPAPKPN